MKTRRSGRQARCVPQMRSQQDGRALGMLMVRINRMSTVLISATFGDALPLGTARINASPASPKRPETAYEIREAYRTCRAAKASGLPNARRVCADLAS